MKYKLIDSEKRKEVQCYYCGTDKSVKYEVNHFDSEAMQEIDKRYCCNKCICVLFDNVEE